MARSRDTWCPLATACVQTQACYSSSDRLVGDEERRWTDENIDMVALKHFPNIDKEKAMSRPILYSNWLSKVTSLHHFRNTSFLLLLVIPLSGTTL